MECFQKHSLSSIRVDIEAKQTYFLHSDVTVELSTLARGTGLASSSHVAVQHSPTLETNQCHAIAERK